MEHQNEEQSYIEPASSETGKTWKNETWEWVKALLIAGVLVFVIRFFLVSPFVVEGPSMEPNFYTGERIMVNKLIYDIRDPKHGEVIVFHAPEGKDYIKRIIALPGETVKVEGDKVSINGTPVDEPYLKEAIQKAILEGHPYNNRNFAEAKVPNGSIFAMGDNRSNSSDSRFPSVGFVPFEKIVGRAELIYWPLNKISLIHF